jgi:hypothetical protein
MRLLHVVPETWPDGLVCRRPGCTDPAVPPHGHCLGHELEHIADRRRRDRELQALGERAAARAPEFYEPLDELTRVRVLGHIAAHAAELGRLCSAALWRGLEDFLQETVEQGARRR